MGREERATTAQPRECARRRVIWSAAVSVRISPIALRRRLVKENSNVGVIGGKAQLERRKKKAGILEGSKHDRSLCL